MISEKHSLAARTNGMLYGDNKPRSLRDRIDDFHSSYQIEANTGCWLWEKSLNERGYGVFWLNGKAMMATHFALLFIKESEKHGVACHCCDTPACVNPDHLFWGTPMDNVHDCIAKRRNSPPPHIEPLPQDLQEKIRSMHVPYKFSIPMIARELGLSVSRVKGVFYGPKLP